MRVTIESPLGVYFFVGTSLEKLIFNNQSCSITIQFMLDHFKVTLTLHFQCSINQQFIIQKLPEEASIMSSNFSIIFDRKQCLWAIILKIIIMILLEHIPLLFKFDRKKQTLLFFQICFILFHIDISNKSSLSRYKMKLLQKQKILHRTK